MNAKDIKIRCSSIGDIMTGVAKGWNVDKSITCKKKLRELYWGAVYGRFAENSNKYTEKGLACEEDAITLYSRFKKQEFRKNAERLTNEWITGEVDLFKGAELVKANHIVDIKNCWTWKQFKDKFEESDSSNEYQGHGYMDLTGAETHTIAYCLVNNTPEAIYSERNKLRYSLAINEETEEYIEGCKKIEADHIYDLKLFKSHNPNFDLYTIEEEFINIPIIARVHEVVFERDEKVISKIHDRVEECREWMDINLFKTQLQTV